MKFKNSGLKDDLLKNTVLKKCIFIYRKYEPC